MNKKPRLLKTRTEIYYMRADQLRAYRRELERMHEQGDNRQRVLDTYEYVVAVFEKRRMRPQGRPKAMISASAVYLLKAEEIRTMIRKLEASASMTEEEHNTLALLRGEEERRVRANKYSYHKRKADALRLKEALCSIP